MNKEIKASALQFQLKAVGDDIQIEDYGSTFGGEPDSHGDIIAKGAFTDSLKARMPKMLYQHNKSQFAGKWTDAAEDNHGLYLKGRFMNTPLSQQAYTECKEGVLDSMSIGFATLDDDYDPTTRIRTLKTIDLYEVSLVTFPANPNATISEVR
jgi:HK97 family phage prohead protease